MRLSIWAALVVLALSAGAIWLDRRMASGPLMTWQEVVGGAAVAAFILICLAMGEYIRSIGNRE